MQSAIYSGVVRHRRFKPAEHAFSYPIFMMYLDLAELPQIFDKHWLWSYEKSNFACYRRQDYWGDPSISLEESIRTLVQERRGFRPQGPIRLLTHLRYFGYCFNPVSVYYCFEKSGEALEALVVEITNTPWGESYCYVLIPDDNRGNASHLKFEFEKDFHISPFMPMDIQYQWQFQIPANHLSIHMNNFKDEAKVFDATMTLKRQEFNSKNLAKTLLRHPWMTAQVVVAIYYQAFRLWWKGVPSYDHPNP